MSDVMTLSNCSEILFISRMINITRSLTTTIVFKVSVIRDLLVQHYSKQLKKQL